MRIAIIITARPSYARVKTVITALVARDIDVHILACASALLERYGKVVDVMRKDFPQVPITEVWSTYEGANLVTGAKETGMLCTELAGVLAHSRFDAGLCIADRHEVLAAAQAVAYQHIPLVHLQGGERTGSIDDKVRDSITQLADIHFVATQLARCRVFALTRSRRIHVTGCPSLDLARHALLEPPVTEQELGGAGASIDVCEPFVVVLQHPVTSEMDYAGAQMDITLGAAHFASHQVIVFWPGEDAGAEGASKTIRMREGLHTVRNLAPTRFLRLLTQAQCLIGNSSVGIRECSFLGVPVVNVGTRQWGRERGPNVMDVPYEPRLIADAVDRQVRHGPYPSSTLYGTGDAGEQIAEVLRER